MLAWVAQLLATYGYWAVALAGAGYLEVWGIIVAAAGGAIVGDTLGYELGRWAIRHEAALHAGPR